MVVGGIVCGEAPVRMISILLQKAVWFSKLIVSAVPTC
jgi:hypothetical protein